jgi:hypothetical protein
MKVKLNEVRLKINGAPQLLVYVDHVDDVNVVRGNINAVKKDIEALIDARKRCTCSCFVTRMRSKIMT